MKYKIIFFLLVLMGAISIWMLRETLDNKDYVEKCTILKISKLDIPDEYNNMRYRDEFISGFLDGCVDASHSFGDKSLTGTNEFISAGITAYNEGEGYGFKHARKCYESITNNRSRSEVLDYIQLWEEASLSDDVYEAFIRIFELGVLGEEVRRILEMP